MQTICGVGYSEAGNSFEAGAEAATQALLNADVNNATFAIFYTTAQQNPQKVAAGVKSVIGEKTKLVGGSAVGVITNDQLGYDGYQVGVAVISNPEMQIDVHLEPDLDQDEFATGSQLGKKIRSQSYPTDPQVLLMYDSVKVPGKTLNLATPLIDGLKSTIGQWPSIAGVGVFGDLKFSAPFLWHDDSALQQSAMACVFSNHVRMDHVIIHGCTPVGDYQTITKVEDNVVLEINHKPATDVIAELLGSESKKTWEDYPLFITLGVNQGDKWDDFDPQMYTNRLTMAIDKERKGLVMFENDLKAGMEFQLMRRDVENYAYIQNVVDKFMATLEDRRPFFALYIDCCGRASKYCGSDQEEASALQKVIGDTMPMLGMYSGVELAMINGELRPLDWTGVLCIFSDC